MDAFADLRPLERRVSKRAADIADRFRRGPGHIEQVLELADYKQQRS